MVENDTEVDSDLAKYRKTHHSRSKIASEFPALNQHIFGVCRINATN